jgi:5-methylcytosine-specific restriction endonuclease McrA
MKGRREPRPISLKRIIQGDRKLRRIERLLMYSEQGGKCYYCHCEMTIDKAYCTTDIYATFDHIVSKTNIRKYRSPDKRLVLACRRCNNEKGSKNAKKFKKMKQQQMLAVAQ